MKAIIWADFKINQDYIAKNLCENKAKPKLKCKGNCQLMKALSKEAKHEQSTNNVAKHKFEVLFFAEIIQPIFPKSISINQIGNTEYSFSNHSFYSNSIFHPPLFSSEFSV